MTAQQKEYQKLTAYTQTRIRTEMFFGSKDPHTQIVFEYGPNGPIPIETTWVPALFTAFREIFDNALDEVITHARGDTIDVTFDAKTMTASVCDNGRGMPIAWDEDEKKYAPTVLLSEQYAGRNFGDDRGSTRGLNGIGAKGVNFCSTWFQVDIERDGKQFSQRFVEGPDNTHVIEDPIILPKKTKSTGTKIEFQLSPKVFHDLRLSDSFVRARMQEAAFCYPKVRFMYNGKRVVTKGVEKDLFPTAKPISIEMNAEGVAARFWMLPEFFADGSELSHSLVNCIPMFNGGIHIESFSRAFYSGMLKAMEAQSKRRKLNPNRSDLSDGMLLYAIIEMDAPKFDGQAKTRLVNENVGKMISAELNTPDFFKSIMRRYPEWIDRVYERCALRTKAKDDSEVSKLARKAGKVRVAKLKDATHSDRSKCSLYITEGDSAVGGLVDARDATIHAAMPLQGKVMNVHGMSAKEMYANKELANLMNAIGLVPGQRVNRHALRYGRLYITTDADEDGKSICGLLTNFFYLNWPDLFNQDKPFIHVFDTPLIIAAKAKDRKYWYADNVDEFDPEKYKSWEITRAKGLAQLKKPDWKFALANPKSFPLVDDGNLAEVLDMLFNKKRASDRRDMIGM